MSLNARIGAVWKDLSPRIRVASTWKTPDTAHIRVGGVWKQVWANLGVNITTKSLYDSDGTSPYSSTTGIYIYNTGVLTQREGATFTDIPGQWLTGGSASEVDVRIVHTGGNVTTLTGMTDGVWYNCGTNRAAYYNRTSTGLGTWIGNIEFRNASTLAAMGSAEWTLQCENGNL